MRHLPAFVVGRTRWVLPMADRSANVLSEAVVLQDIAQAAQLLAEQLALDPPLVLWAVLQHKRSQEEAGGEAIPPENVRAVAEWLAENAAARLQWPGQADDYQSADPIEAERAADQVAADLAVAELAGLLAAPEGEAAADEAQFLGLLSGAPAWLTLSVRGRKTSPRKGPLAWPGEFGDRPVVGRVLEAAEILSGFRKSACLVNEVEVCRRRGLEGRRKWLDLVAGPGLRLPQLMERLGRLAQLETKFQEAVEIEKLAAMAEFAAGAGHEINNPLAIIGGRAQLLLRDETDPERRRELATIAAQAKRAYEMIADMRHFARPAQPEFQSVDFSALLDGLVAELAPTMTEQRIELARVGPRDPVQVDADPTQWQVALRALVRNAQEAIGHDGRIELGVWPHADRVEIRITDTGPGISPEHRRHLFDPYYSSRQAGRGLGMGLSKCWQIVSLHHGKIEVGGEPGRGAVFTLWVPYCQ
jgi:signal transduction histidine kinase